MPVLRVKEVADLVGISVRTLHHYDEIGLLIPDKESESGYRLYSDDHLETLQQILFFRELGFPLKKIKDILNSPSFDRKEALALHYKMLLEKRNQLDQLIQTVEKSMTHAEGGVEMSNQEKFVGFDFGQNPYEQEARERWGDAAIDRSNAKIGKMKPSEQQALGEKMNEIYRKLAGLRHTSPSSEEAQEAIRSWYDVLNEMGDYSPEAFKGLGQMYVDDVRFTESIDQFGEGLAEFMRDAMAIFADRMNA